MIKNFFKIAWRNIKRHKAYSGINILGLAIGIAACLLILQYVSFELSYENFQTNKNRIYRVEQDRYDNGKLSTQWAAGAYAVGNSFKDAIPEIEDYVKVTQNSKVVTDVKNQPLKIEKVFCNSCCACYNSSLQQRHNYQFIFGFCIRYHDGRTRSR
jgi:putative ABC transport system permease protein